MYNERKDSFSVRDIAIQLLVIILFIFILLWLFPTKSYVEKLVNNNAYNGDNGSTLSGELLSTQVFNENVKTMKEAAISYFTTSRLPKKVGDKVTLTLNEMLNEKMLLAFTDSSGKSCNLNSSYIEITKTDGEYILKVNLSCEDKTDYILVHLGCYSYCEDNICEKQETPIKTTPTSKNPVKPVDNRPSEPEKPDDNKPSKPDDKDPEPEKPDDKDPEPVKVYEYEYAKAGDTKWVWNTDWSSWSTVPVTPSSTVKVETQDIYVGGGSYTEYADIIVKNEVGSCPSGSWLGYDSTTKKYYCMKTSVVDAVKGITKTPDTCPSGYNFNSNKTACVKTYAATKKVSDGKEKCPSGYSFNSNKTACVKTYAATKSTKTTALQTNTTTKVTYENYTTPKSGSNYTLLSTETKPSCNTNGCKSVTTYYYKVTTKITTTSCPAGYTKNSKNTACYKYEYTCNSGDKRNNTTCTSTTGILKPLATETYSCKSSADKLNNSTKTCTSTKDVIKGTLKADYKCADSRYTLNSDGKTCGYTEKTERPVKQTFTCPAGYTYSSTGKCARTTIYSGNYIRQYRYLTGKYETTSGSTVWSKTQNDKNLINQGYIYTGNIREVK